MRTRVFLCIGVLAAFGGTAATALGGSQPSRSASVLRAKERYQLYGGPTTLTSSEVDALYRQGVELHHLLSRAGGSIPARDAVTVVRSTAFDWGDFGLGAAAAGGFLILLTGLGVGAVALRRAEEPIRTQGLPS